MMTNRIHVREFNNYLGELSRSMGKGVAASEVIKSEASAILVRASKITKRANKSKIGQRYTIKARDKSSMPKGHERKRVKGRFAKEGRIKGSKTPQDPELVPFVFMRGKKYSTSNFYPEPIWKEIKSKLAYYKKRAKARVFSGKASWLLVARKARLNTQKFASKASLEKAISSQAERFRRDSTEYGKPLPSMFKFRLKIFNNSTATLNKSARGHFAIKSAMGGRQGFFRQNMKMGVFKSAARIGKKYPGVKVRA